MNQSHLTNGFNSAVILPPLSKVETPKHTYLDNRGIKSQRKRRRTMSEGARERLQTKKHLTNLAVELGAAELAHKLNQCHAFVRTLTCGRHVSRIMPNATCEFRLCPDCGRRRSRKLISKHLPIMQEFVKRHRCEPVHLTLTQAHRPETRKEAVKRLKAAFTKLQRRAFWKEYFIGGSWAVEFSEGKDGLHHAHLHIIAFRKRFFHIDLLREEWRAVTGDSHVFKLDRITDLANGLMEVLKYVSKPMDIKNFTKDDLADFMKLKDTRMFGTFGEYRKFSGKFSAADNDTDPLSTDLKSERTDLVEGCACPQCDEPLFELNHNREELIEFYKYLEVAPPIKKTPPS